MRTRSLPSSYATGNQLPTNYVIPDFDTNDVLDTLDLLSEAGFECMDWQAFLLEAWMGVLPNGRWAAPVVGNETPRQNGKTRDIQGRSAAEMLFYDGTVIYTAQLQKTSTETFEEMAQLMDTKPLRKYLAPKGIRTALGREEIRLKNGPKMKFLARTRNGGNGQHGSLLIFDEAQYLEPQSQGSFLAAISACRTRRGPQTIYNGNSPEEGDYGLVLERIRDGALSGKSRRTAWTEWSIGCTREVPDVTDRADWVRTNPSWGVLIMPDTVEAEFDSEEAVQFAHQRLGWFQERAGTDRMFSAKEWDALEVQASPETWQKKAFGVRFERDGKSVSLAVCVTNAAAAHVEFIREEPMSSGIGWLVDWLSRPERARTVSAIVISGKSDAEDLRDQLVKRHVPKGAVVVATSGNASSATGMMVNAVRDRTVSHVADPALRDSALSVMRKQSGDGYLFDGECPQRLEACALAMWAARTSKRQPTRKGRAGC